MENLASNTARPVHLFSTRRDAMHEVCPDWEVPQDAWQAIEPCVALPDPKDRHVLAAAIAGHADSIITQNLRDFPSEAIAPLGITALHPDEFLLQQLELEPLLVLSAFKKMRARLKKPAFTPEYFADSM